MTERPRVIHEMVDDRLDHFSPLELRCYLAAWANATFEQFCAEAEACKIVAEQQIRATEFDDEDLQEWIRTLLLIEGSLRYARAVQVSLTMGQYPDSERGLEYFKPAEL